MNAANHVEIYEVGPRDGLQNEKQPISVDAKLDLIGRLAKTGLQNIEVGSFVSPKWVPQMADTDHIVKALPDPLLNYQVLIPNMRGLDGYFAAVEGIDHPPKDIAIFLSASEGFSQSNLNCSIAESFDRALPMVDAARKAGLNVRSYISCVTDCPFDGPIAPERVATVARRLSENGLDWQSLGDTIGKGTPDTIGVMLDAVLSEVPAKNVAGHFHDTNGFALQNIDVSLSKGLRAFDASIGGLGGCPYAPGAPGNVPTETVIAHLHAAGFETGVNLDDLMAQVEFAKGLRS